jgi:hypothetical protein
MKYILRGGKILKRDIWERQTKEKGGWGVGYADEAGGESCNLADKQNHEKRSCVK